MKTSRIQTRKIAYSALIGAAYAALTMALYFISYGPIQFRIAEALCILPFFFPYTVPGLFLGCLVANLLSPYGIVDIVAGSMATLLAVVCTMLIGKMRKPDGNATLAVRILACAPTVIFNAIIIGAVIAWSGTSSGGPFWYSFAISGLQVGLGELAVMYLVGLPLMILLPKTQLFRILT